MNSPERANLCGAPFELQLGPYNRSEMMCECYQIGGRFIAEDPDCPAHGTKAQRRSKEYDDAMADMRRELDAWQRRFPQYVFRPQDDCVALRA